MTRLPFYEYNSDQVTQKCKSTGQNGKDMCKLMYKYGSMHLKKMESTDPSIGSFIVVESLDTKVKFNGIFYGPSNVYMRYIPPPPKEAKQKTDDSPETETKKQNKLTIFNSGQDPKFNGQLIICHEAKETDSRERLWMVVPIQIVNGSSNKVFENNLGSMLKVVNHQLSNKLPDSPEDIKDVRLQEAIPNLRVRKPYTYVNYEDDGGMMHHIVHFNSTKIDMKGITFKVPKNIIDITQEFSQHTLHDSESFDQLENEDVVFDADDEAALVNMENQIVDRSKHRMTCRPVEVSGGKDNDGNVLTYKVEAGSGKSIIEKGIDGVRSNGVAVTMGLFGFLIIMSCLLAMLYVMGGIGFLKRVTNTK